MVRIGQAQVAVEPVDVELLLAPLAFWTALGAAAFAALTATFTRRSSWIPATMDRDDFTFHFLALSFQAFLRAVSCKLVADSDYVPPRAFDTGKLLSL